MSTLGLILLGIIAAMELAGIIVVTIGMKNAIEVKEEE